MNRPLQTLTATTFVTWTGQRITAVALPLVALDQTGDAWTTGLVGGMAGLPLLTSGWWGRRLRDRLDSGRALALLLVVQVAGLLLVPLAAVTTGVGAAVLCASGLATGATGALLAPAQRALTADLADADPPTGSEESGGSEAARALAWQDFAHRVSMIFAPPLAAWLVAVGGAVPLLWCEAAAVALSAVAMLTVPGAPSRGSAPAASGPTTGATAAGGVRADRAGVSMRRVLSAHPEVAAGIALAGVGGLVWFAFTLGLALLGAELDRPGELVAAGMAGYGVASVAASFATPHLINRVPRMPAIAVSSALLGTGFAALPAVSPNLAAIAVVSAIGGASMPLGIAALNALISERTTGAERRAAFTAETVLHSGGASLGLLVGGGIIGAAGAGPTLVAAGALQVAATVVATAWLAARRRNAERNPAVPQPRPGDPRDNREPARAT